MPVMPAVAEHEEVVPARAAGFDQRADRLTLGHARVDGDAGGLVSSRFGRDGLATPSRYAPR